MAPPLSFPLLLLTIIIFSSSTFSSLEAKNSRHISSIISRDLYKSIFLHKDDIACPAKKFYPYSAFIKATERFPSFGNCGSLATRKREIAAFLAQISHETTGGWATAPDGPYSWGLCYKEEISPGSSYCDSTNLQWPCYPNKTYQGRGPIQLSWNFNYGPAGKALGFNGLKTPELVSNNSVIAFKTALWFWMTEQKPKPSCHDVMTGRYKPTAADLAANRTAGYGLVTNIINGGLECGIVSDGRVNDRIGYFQRYVKLFKVSTGPNVDCESQKSF